MIVRLPVPMSCVPQRITTLPSEAISQCARAPVPAPPQRLAEQPSPRLIGPGAGSPVTWRLFQSIRSAPIGKYFAHIAFGASGGRFFSRNSIGSIRT